MKPLLVVFDLDGTLVDYHHSYLYENALQVAHDYGLTEITIDHLAKHHALDDIFGYLECEKTKQTLEEFLQQRICFSTRPKPVLIQGALNTLEELASKDIKLAIATARHQPPNELENELKLTGLLNWITCIETRTRERDPWRDKSNQILRACAYFNIDPAKSIMVGDHPSDISSAKQVGVGTTVSVLTGEMDVQLLKSQNPSHIINSILELKDIVK